MANIDDIVKQLSKGVKKITQDVKRRLTTGLYAGGLAVSALMYEGCGREECEVVTDCERYEQELGCEDNICKKEALVCNGDNQCVLFGYHKWYKKDECSSNFGCNEEEVCQNNKCVSLNEKVENQKITKLTTNSEGLAFFNDNEEEVTIRVTDTSNHPLPEMEVIYFDGIDYETFLTSDPHAEFSTALNVYSHNSTHNVKMCKKTEGICISQVLEENISSFNRWKENNFEKENIIKSEEYIKTIGLDEKLRRDISRRELRDELFYFGTEKFMVIMGIPSEVLDNMSVKDIWTKLKTVQGIDETDESTHPRWDVYRVMEWKDYGTFISIPTGPGITIVPSNIPYIEELKAKTESDKVNITWKVTDSDHYKTELVELDWTYELPPTSKIDLLFKLNIKKDGSIIQTEEKNGTIDDDYSLELRLTKGNYIASLIVTDEVGNSSDASINFNIDYRICEDNDGDGYGVGADCLGPDCDDNDSFMQMSGYLHDNTTCRGSDEGECNKPYRIINCEDGIVTEETECINGQGPVSEICDNKDNDCDGETDEGVCSASCIDRDGDGWSKPNCGGDCNDNDSSIYPGAAEVTDGKDNDCDGDIDENIVTAGNPQVTLFWNGSADLDLHVYSPNNECHLWYNNTNCGTGHLDRDAMANCNVGQTPPENVFWEEGTAPNGEYTIKVRYFEDCGEGRKPFHLSASVGNRTVLNLDDAVQRECESDDDHNAECEKAYTFVK